MNKSTKPTVYICGPVTGIDPDKVRTAFNEAESKLENDYNVINPTKLVAPNTEWHIAMRKCVEKLAQADHIYLLSGWHRSAGAQVEHELAQQLKINFINW